VRLSIFLRFTCRALDRDRSSIPSGAIPKISPFEENTTTYFRLLSCSGKSRATVIESTSTALPGVDVRIVAVETSAQVHSHCTDDNHLYIATSFAIRPYSCDMLFIFFRTIFRRNPLVPVVYFFPSSPSVLLFSSQLSVLDIFLLWNYSGERCLARKKIYKKFFPRKRTIDGGKK